MCEDTKPGVQCCIVLQTFADINFMSFIYLHAKAHRDKKYIMKVAIGILMFTISKGVNLSANF